MSRVFQGIFGAVHHKRKCSALVLHIKLTSLQLQLEEKNPISSCRLGLSKYRIWSKGERLPEEGEIAGGNDKMRECIRRVRVFYGPRHTWLIAEGERQTILELQNSFHLSLPAPTTEALTRN